MRQALQQRGGQIVAISADSPERLFSGAAEHPELPCLFACDPHAEAAEKLNLLQTNMLRVGKRIAVPANILVDRRGIVRWVHYAHLVMDRPDPQYVLAQILNLD